MSAQLAAQPAGDRGHLARAHRRRHETPASLLVMAPAERARRTASLQFRLAGATAALDADIPGSSIVVVPSRAADKWDESPAETQAYEERLLCLVLLLRRPNLRVVYVTSVPVAPRIVEHYLSLLGPEVGASAAARLTLLHAADASPRPLACKVLERPLLLHRIRRAIGDPAACHLVPYSPTEADCDLALVLGIPMYAAAPAHARFGTKSGCRELFAQEGVAHPLGVQNLTSLAALVEAVAAIRALRPGLDELVVKLNEGVSGDGNAILDVRDLPRPGAPGEQAAIRRRLRAMAFEAPEARFEPYLAKLAARGAVVEERIVGSGLRSPSVQLQVTPDGDVEVISTHDQLLGGQSGQSFLGCSFPADRAYAREITEQALIVGARLAREGVIGRFAIDFVVVRDPAGGWRAFAIEINLRKGGTTHPYLTLALLTGGRYDPACARFRTPDGAARHLVATDHLKVEGLDAAELLAIVERHGLRFDAARGDGVVLHMLSAAGAGRVGVTAIAASAEAAARLYERTAAVLFEEAVAARDVTPAQSRVPALVPLPASSGERKGPHPSGPFVAFRVGIAGRSSDAREALPASDT